MKLDVYLTQVTKINSKWTKHLSVRSETVRSELVKFLKENILDVGFGKDFLGKTQKTWETKAIKDPKILSKTTSG